MSELRIALLTALAELSLAGCIKSSEPLALPARDWAEDPALIDVRQPRVLYAISDVHGAYDRLTALLAAHALIREVPTDPSAVVWTGGDAVLIVAGDLFDKGPRPLEVAELLRALEASVTSSAARVITLIGNHEAEFLANPQNDKAVALDGISHALDLRGIVPEEFAAGDDPTAVWLRRRPFAASVGGWFFVHAGNTGGRTRLDLEGTIEQAVDTRGYGDPEIIGKDSLLEARNWYSDDPGAGARFTAALMTRHIVFGHDPNGLGPRGQIAISDDGALFRIDCGMTPTIGNSMGVMLRVRREAGRDVAEALTPDGMVSELWREEP